MRIGMGGPVGGRGRLLGQHRAGPVPIRCLCAAIRGANVLQEQRVRHAQVRLPPRGPGLAGDGDGLRVGMGLRLLLQDMLRPLQGVPAAAHPATTCDAEPGRADRQRVRPVGEEQGHGAWHAAARRNDEWREAIAVARARVGAQLVHHHGDGVGDGEVRAASRAAHLHQDGRVVHGGHAVHVDGRPAGGRAPDGTDGDALLVLPKACDGVVHGLRAREHASHGLGEALQHGQAQALGPPALREVAADGVVSAQRVARGLPEVVPPGEGVAPGPAGEAQGGQHAGEVAHAEGEQDGAEHLRG
mmetsp:Transcript_19039/g.63768  ORF Transcript_19039/g.63768 Transcript_19039/m.63768 type:complete len:301 (+) Transcript_19039:189-1091(+)